MRICFLADGSHVNCANWAEYFSNKLGHEVHIISIVDSKPNIPNVNFHIIKPLPYFKKFSYLLSILKVKKIVQKINPDILLGYRVSSYGFLGACTGFHPLVLAAQGYNIDNPEKSFFKNILIRYAIRNADIYHAWGTHMRDCFINLGAPQDKISTFPRGVKTNIFTPSGFNNSNKLTIIMTRGLKPNYDLELALKAMSILNKKGIDFCFYILGDGTYKKSLENLSYDLGIEKKVLFMGNIKNDELPSILRKARIYISPVPTDGVSASLLEAMSCGLIPIVVDNEANRLWITNGKNGFLFKRGNYFDLADAILKTHRGHFNENKIGVFNRNFVIEKADFDVNMKKIEGYYERLISKHLH